CEMSQRAQRIIEAARKVPLPEGTYAVGFGLIISGLTAYGFQILAFKALDKPEYAALNGLWIFVFVVAPGFFLPLEQEVGRAVAIPPVIASVIALRGQRGLLAPGPEAEWSELSTNLTLLFLGSLTAQTLSYSAALGAILLAKGPRERAEAADFIVGFFIAR